MININNYKIRVYIDDIEGWQEIKSGDIKILNNHRAIVTTSNETTVSRIFKKVDTIQDCRADGCVYLIKKPKST